jgi:DNA-binding XRE family transcriptional regulator
MIHTNSFRSVPLIFNATSNLSLFKQHNRYGHQMSASENEINVIAGRNIRAVREKIGLSQDAFADVCQVHRTYIGSVERGERNITLNTLAMIAKAAKTTPIALLTAKGRGK